MRQLVTFLALVTMAASASPAMARETSGTRVAVQSTRAWQIAGYHAPDVDGEPWAISPDGRWLAGLGVAEGPGAGPAPIQERLFCVWAVETGESRCDPELLLIDPTSIIWAPDSEAVAYMASRAYPIVSGQSLRVFEVATGTTTHLTELSRDVVLTPGTTSEPATVDDQFPTWSPDGRELAFARTVSPAGETTLMRVARVGGESRVIVRLQPPEPQIVNGPLHWLADGTLLFALSRLKGAEAQNGLWRIGVDGDNPRQVLPGRWDDPLPTPRIVDVSADGRWASVAASYPATPYLWDDENYGLLDLQKGTVTPLAAQVGERVYVTAPARFSPDGTSAIFGVAPRLSRGAAPRSIAPVVMDLASGAQSFPGLYLSAAERVHDRGMPWVASNTVLTLDRDGRPALLTLDEGAPATPAATPTATAEGGEALGWRVAGQRAVDVDGDPVALSPDGRWLAGQGPARSFCIWEMATLAATCDGEFARLWWETVTWAPDSSAVAVTLSAESGDSGDLYVFEVENETLRNLTDEAPSDIVVEDEAGPGDLIFDDSLGGLGGIRTDAELVFDYAPTWSPDGRELAFARSPQADLEWPDPSSQRVTIMRIARDGGEPEPVLDSDTLAVGQAEPGFDNLVGAHVPGRMWWMADDRLLVPLIYDGTYTGRPLYDDDRTGIWAVGLDGAAPRQVLRGDHQAEVPLPIIADVAADGRWASISTLLYAGAQDMPTSFLLDLETGAVTPVATGTEPAAWVATPPRFSPDGTALLYAIGGTETATLVIQDRGLIERAALAPAAPEVWQVSTPPTLLGIAWAASDTLMIPAADGPARLLMLERTG